MANFDIGIGNYDLNTDKPKDTIVSYKDLIAYGNGIKSQIDNPQVGPDKVSQDLLDKNFSALNKPEDFQKEINLLKIKGPDGNNINIINLTADNISQYETPENSTLLNNYLNYLSDPQNTTYSNLLKTSISAEHNEQLTAFAGEAANRTQELYDTKAEYKNGYKQTRESLKTMYDKIVKAGITSPRITELQAVLSQNINQRRAHNLGAIIQASIVELYRLGLYENPNIKKSIIDKYQGTNLDDNNQQFHDNIMFQAFSPDYKGQYSTDGIIGGQTINSWKSHINLINNDLDKKVDKIKEDLEKTSEQLLKGPTTHVVQGGPAGMTIESNYEFKLTKKGDKSIQKVDQIQELEYDPNSIKINDQRISDLGYNITSFDKATGTFTIEKNTNASSQIDLTQTASTVTLSSQEQKVEGYTFQTQNKTIDDIKNGQVIDNIFSLKEKKEGILPKESITILKKGYKNPAGEVKQLLYSPQNLSKIFADKLASEAGLRNIPLISQEPEIGKVLEKFTGADRAKSLSFKALDVKDGKVVNVSPDIVGSGTREVEPYLAFIPDPVQREAMKQIMNADKKNRKMSFEVKNGKVTGLDLDTLPVNADIINKLKPLENLKIKNFILEDNINTGISLQDLLKQGSQLNGKPVEMTNQDLTYDEKRYDNSENQGRGKTKSGPFLLKYASIINGDRKLFGD